MRAPWIWEVVPNYHDSVYGWVVRNRVMHSDQSGVTIRYRPRTTFDVICGERTDHPDRGVEVVCSIVGDHAEMPHVGVPAACADMTCSCAERGSYHLVIVGLSITPPRTAHNPSYERNGSDQGLRERA